MDNIKEITKYFADPKKYVGIVNSVFLLALAVSGNYVGETLGCKTQYAMTNNMYVKQMVLFFMIYFTLNFVTTESMDPTDSIMRAFLIWIMFLLFTKMNPTFTIVFAILLTGVYIMNNYITYYDSVGENEKSKNIGKYQRYGIITLVVLIILGFGIYTREKYIEYGSDFSITKFIFGVVKCKSLE